MEPRKNIIVVMGMTGVGKSFLVQSLSENDVRVGHGLSSCTQGIEAVECVISGNTITLLDTPGFDDTHRTDTEILESIAQWLAEMHNHKVCGVIYLHSILDDRMRGSSYKNLVMFEKMCGREALKNVVMLTNRWGHIDDQKACDRESELANTYWKMYLEAGCRLMRYRTRDDLIPIVDDFLNICPIHLSIQREMVDECKPLNETSAGGLIQMGAELEQAHNMFDASLNAIVTKHNEDITSYNNQRLEYQKTLAKIENSITQLANHRTVMLYDSSRDMHIQICHDRLMVYAKSLSEWHLVAPNPTGHWENGIFFHGNGHFKHVDGSKWWNISPEFEILDKMLVPIKTGPSGMGIVYTRESYYALH
ncbi:hypothetical protein BGX27_009148 [Mortierella sp. AM989]|nr:hypothetical protein BGX27_009148 [Mortierella sp. AM989]